MKTEENKVTYMEGAMAYTVNLKDNTGSKMENPMLKGFEGQDLTEVGEKMMKQMGTKSWVWKGVPMKTELNMMGIKINVVATKISENFDKSKLQRPKNIDYKDMSEMMKGLFGN